MTPNQINEKGVVGKALDVPRGRRRRYQKRRKHFPWPLGNDEINKRLKGLVRKAGKSQDHL